MPMILKMKQMRELDYYNKILLVCKRLDYELPSDFVAPKNYKERFSLICKKHGLFTTFWNSLQSGRQCPSCSKEKRLFKRRLTEGDIEQIVQKQKFKLINCDNYKNLKSTINVMCCNGHITEKKLSSFYRRVRCDLCHSVTTERISELISGKYSLPEEYIEPKNAHDKISLVCCDHGIFQITWANLKLGHGCPKCGKEKHDKSILLSDDEISNRLKNNNLTLVSIDRPVLTFRCKNNHICTRNMYELFKNFNCTSCCTTISKAHQEIYDYIKSIYSKEIKINDRSTISPFELDIYIPEFNLGIEFDGLYWHSEKHNANIKKINTNKIEQCKQKNINLLAIFEDEWANQEKQELIKNMIRHRLKITTGPKLRSSKLEIRQLKNNSDFKEFFDKYHLDGHTQASFAYGLFYENTLVSCMSFRKSFADKCWEIARFATNYNYMVYGNASKILKKYQEDVGDRLITYSNNRLSHGNVYKQLGFKEITKTTQPSYYYTDFKTRLWRFKCRKINDPEILKEYPTEREQAAGGVFSQKYLNHNKPLYRIYDYGHRKWEI